MKFQGFYAVQDITDFLVWTFFFFKFTLVAAGVCMAQTHTIPWRWMVWCFPPLPSPASPYTPLGFCSLWLLCSFSPWSLCTFCSLCLGCSTPILFTRSTSHPSDVSFKSSLLNMKIKTITRYHFTNTFNLIIKKKAWQYQILVGM